MGTLGTFDSFTTARLGIYAAQHGLRVTGNNISNINTSGYTRQRVDQVSFKTGNNDTYRSWLDNHVGSGALVTGINQVRDPFLDIRYRNTSSNTAYSDTMLAGLQQIQSILDEVGKGGDTEDKKGDGLLYNQLQDIFKSLERLSSDPTSDNDTLVRTSAEALTALFHTYANKLETLHQNTEKDLTQSIASVNEILTNIRDLNKQIRDCDINGDAALELRDERNRQIDELSEYMHINVEYSMENVGGGVQVEKLTISLGGDNPDPNVETDSALLIDGLYGTQISIPKERPSINPYKDITNADVAADPTLADYQKLGGYLFLRESTVEPDPADNLDYVQTTNDAGDTIYLIGTNDPASEGIITEPNDNYSIQLGKLLNSKGAEWKSPTTTWEDVSVKKDALAQYQVKITPPTLAAGETFEFGVKDHPNSPFTVTEADVADPDTFAAFLADKLNAVNADYTVTAKGDGSGALVFTAKNAGPIGGGNGPDKAPSLTLDPPDGGIGIGKMAQINPGYTLEPPDDIDLDDYPMTVTDPRTGTEVTTSYAQVEGRWFKVTTETKHTFETALDDNDLHGSLQATRELLTEKGEFSTADDVSLDENATIRRGIPYYQKSLDLLARKFAESFNALNQGVALDQDGNVVYKEATGTPEDLELEEVKDGAGAGYYVDKNGYYVGQTGGQHDPECLLNKAQINVSDPLETALQKIKDADPDNTDLTGIVDDDGNIVDQAAAEGILTQFLQDHGVDAATNPPDQEITVNAPISMGGVLFSNRNDGDDPTGINASNIDIAHSWSTGDVQIVPRFEILFDGEVTDSTQNRNIDHMISLIDQALVYDPTDLDPGAVGKKLFEGSFNDMFSNMMTVQGKDQRITNIQLNTHYTSLVELDSSREGVSGVDLNDEAMNMMQFQKAYTAACRLMTAIDEVLDRLINNTGIAGR